MTDLTQGSLFDYNALDSEIRSDVQRWTSEIRTFARRAAQDVVEIGQRLLEVKQRLGHGNFGAWLEAEFHWSESAAVKMMQVAIAFKSVNFTDFDVSLSALYLLAAPSTPEPARVEAIARAEIGEDITYSSARQIVNEYKNTNDLLETANDAVIEQTQPMAEPRMCPYCGWPYRAMLEHGLTQCPSCQRLHAYSGPRDVATYGPYPAQMTPTTLEILHSSNSVEWYTPAPYIESARQVLGEIDLDPASCAFANATVRAARYYSPEADEDGLVLPWAGRLWVNPPYGRAENNQSNQARWSARLVQAYRDETIDAAILLVSANTGEKWFQALWEFPICFTHHRINFYGPPDQQNSGPNHGSVLVYFGTDIDAFRQHMFVHGRVVIPRGAYSEVNNV